MKTAFYLAWAVETVGGGDMSDIRYGMYREDDVWSKDPRSHIPEKRRAAFRGSLMSGIP